MLCLCYVASVSPASWWFRRHRIASAGRGVHTIFSWPPRDASRPSSWHSRRTYRSIVVSYCCSCFSCCCRCMDESSPISVAARSRSAQLARYGLHGSVIEAFTFTHFIADPRSRSLRGATATVVWISNRLYILYPKRPLFMAALWNRAGHYIFALWFLLLSSSIFLFSSPNLNRRTLDVCHTSTHGVTLVWI